MEVKIYFKDGSIEKHAIPELVGVNTSRFNEKESREQGSNSLDHITDIVERFYLNSQGFILERYTVSMLKENDSGTIGRYDRPVKEFTNGSEGNCILPVSQLSLVKMVLVDDEQVYPEVKEIDFDNLGS